MRLSLIWPEDAIIALNDRGLSYGDGLFETIRVGQKGAIYLQEHLARLLNGARALGIPLSEEDLCHWRQAATARGLLGQSGVMKLSLTRGQGGRGYQPPSSPSPQLITQMYPLPDFPATPVSLHLCPIHLTPACAPLQGVKSLNRLPQVLAAATLQPPFFEGIMCDSQGRLIEGTRSNLIMARAGALWVPPRTSLAVDGIMLNKTLALARQWGYPVITRFFGFQQLQSATGLAMTNSLWGLLAADRVDCLRLPQDPILSRLAQCLLKDFQTN